jgi:hypothetical protein
MWSYLKVMAFIFLMPFGLVLAELFVVGKYILSATYPYSVSSKNVKVETKSIKDRGKRGKPTWWESIKSKWKEYTKNVIQDIVQAPRASPK